MDPGIIVKNRTVATLSEMMRLTLKKIFDQKGMTYDEEKLLEDSVTYWPKKIGLEPYEKKDLKRIIDALIRNELGKFEKAKETMKKHKLDYKKVYSAGL